ncbi:MAG TPA: DUF6659 family protein [Candidatus Nitrosotenuis sp.]|nr:DUF6659 family protein [Candidatus Nitrosotenuis sp.]
MQETPSAQSALIRPGVEFVGIISKSGKLTNWVGSVCFQMSDADMDLFFMKIALRSSMQKDFDKDLGEVTCCITQRESRKFISIPTSNDKTVLVITKNDYAHEQLVSDIRNSLKHSGRFLGESVLMDD